MDFKDRLIEQVSSDASERICRKVIIALQRRKDCLQSGDDSGLGNVWDEVCVQVQSQEAVMRDAYEETIRGLLEVHVEQLPSFVKRAIWLQTDEGSEWQFGNKEEESAPYSTSDIVEYIFSHVLQKAGDWSNSRISRYLDPD